MSFAFFDVAFIATVGLLYPTLPNLLAVQAVGLAFLTVWNILTLDVVWWQIRYVDIRYLHRDYYDNRDGQATHRITDFDAAGLPLWFGVYSWWYVLTFVLIGLGVTIVSLLPPLF
jgi:hypothetical protein